ncbi:hypothetical protein ACFW8Z_08305, partial [Streptomyces sp. NPDC059515]
MSFHPFEDATDASAPAGEVLAALRARGSSAAAGTCSGEALADWTDGLLKPLAEHGVRHGEPVHVAAAGPAEVAVGCLAVWLAGGVPGTGPATAVGGGRRGRGVGGRAGGGGGRA